MRGLLALTVVLVLAGCSLSPPRAWEKDLLARPGMAIDTGHLGRRFDDHIYTSRENASGGTGVGGGGCGCN